MSTARAQRIGLAAWIVCGLVVLVCLTVFIEPRPLPLIIAAALLLTLPLPWMLQKRSGAFLYALLLSILLAAAGLTEAVANETNRGAASILAVASLACFVALMPAARGSARRH